MPDSTPGRAFAPAKRLGNFTESVIREQTRLARVHGSVNLAQGFPDFPCDPVLKELARNAIDGEHNQYSVTWGMQGLREAIAKKAREYNGIEADADRNVTVTCGATEAMICAFLAISIRARRSSSSSPSTRITIRTPTCPAQGPFT